MAKVDRSFTTGGFIGADRIQLLDAIEDEVKQGGYIIDWHACDLFPKSWIDLVVVLRVETSLLYDRLKARLFSPLTSSKFDVEEN